MSIVKSKIKLKPCPFCLDKVELFIRKDYGEKYYDIKCETKDCYLFEGADWWFTYSEIDELIEKWNTRTDCRLSFKNLDEVE